jgi:hypothetical protein
MDEQKCPVCGADVVDGKCSADESHDVSTPAPEAAPEEAPQE